MKNSLTWGDIYKPDHFARFFIAWVEDQIKDTDDGDCIVRKKGMQLLGRIHGASGSDKWDNILNAVNNDCKHAKGELNLFCSEFVEWMGIQIACGGGYHGCNPSLWTFAHCRFAMFIVLREIKLHNRARKEIGQYIASYDGPSIMPLDYIETTADYMFDPCMLKE